MREAVIPVTAPANQSTIEAVRKRFTIWRKNGRRGRRVSENLWGAAVELCRDHPVSRVSRVLRLDYYGLRNRVHKSKETESGNFGFVNFDVGVPLVSPPEWRVEMEAPNGAKMTLTVKGAPGDVDPLELSRAFWSQGR